MCLCSAALARSLPAPRVLLWSECCALQTTMPSARLWSWWSHLSLTLLGESSRSFLNEGRSLLTLCSHSVKNGDGAAPLESPGSSDSVMGGLNCNAISPDAWPLLRDTFDAVVLLDDDWVSDTRGAQRIFQVSHRVGTGARSDAKVCLAQWIGRAHPLGPKRRGRPRRAHGRVQQRARPPTFGARQPVTCIVVEHRGADRRVVVSGCDKH